METKDYLSAIARKGAGKCNLGKMCDDCAFRKGSGGNEDGLAVERALFVLLGGGEFRCHNSDLQDAGTPCIGFLYAQAAFEEPK